MEAIEYFNAAKSTLDIDSDYALAKHLGITPKRISAIRHRRTTGFDTETAFKIAEILDIDPAYVIADMEILRKNANVSFWEGVKAKSSGTAAAILTTVVLCATPDTAQAASMIPAGLPTDSLCIMRVSCGVQGIVEQLFKLALTWHMPAFCTFGYAAV